MKRGRPLQSIGTLCRELCNKSSAVAEMGDRGHNRHGPKRGGVLCPFRGALGTRLIQCGLRGGLLPYSDVFIHPAV